MDTELERIINKAIEILKSGEEHNPACLAYREDNPLEAFGFTVPEDTRDRLKMWTQLALTAVLSGADKALVITEAWMLHMDKDNPDIRPSQSSKRIECLTINQVCKDKSKDVLVTIPFYRNNLGVEVKEPQILKGELSGAVHDIFRKVFDTAPVIEKELVQKFKEFLEKRNEN